MRRFLSHAVRAFIFGMAAAIVSPAAGQTTYTDSHNFDIRFNQPVPSTARWQHFEHAWMYWEGAGNDVQVNPPIQPAGWFPWSPAGFTQDLRVVGMNFQRQQIELNSALQNYDPRAGFDQVSEVTATANIGVSNARSKVRTWPDANNADVLHGSIGVEGGMNLRTDHHKGGLASSGSILRFDIGDQTQWPSIISWTPNIRVSSNQEATWEAGRVMLVPRDPVLFERTGANGETERMRAVDIWLEQARAENPDLPLQFSWADGRLTGNNIGEILFQAEIGGPMMLPGSTGTARMRITGGRVVESVGLGIFEGLVPPVGTAGTFDFDFSRALELHITPLPLPPGYTGALELSSGLGREIPAPGCATVLVVSCVAVCRRRTRSA